MEPAPEWAPEDVREKVLDELDLALATESPVHLCREELAAPGVGALDELPERLRYIVRLRPPTWGQIVKRYEDPPQKPFVGWREVERWHGERVRAFEEEVRRRDEELIAQNRRACGLPPLEGGEGHRGA